MSDNATATTAELARLFDITSKTIAMLGSKGIIVPAGKRGRWRLQPSVVGYVRHLREEAAARGGHAASKARARLGEAQANLAEARAERMRGEVAPIAEVEAKWTAACRSIRARVMAVSDRMRLTGKMHGKLVTELRSALTDLADGNAA